ncbi:MAG: hypothetical protein NTX01_08755 [Candidatus Omnitrophica bacterium]|nr:hypothetical protein [Candidatus Omnitrophota bacterium]
MDKEENQKEETLERIRPSQMNKKINLKWLEKENDIYIQSMIALIAALIASKIEGVSVLDQPCNWGISVSLFIFCLLLRIKYHLAEPRLREFDSRLSESQSDREKSIEQIHEELYLYSSYTLCLSILHFYIFLVAFSIFLIVNLCYHKIYLNYQRSEKPDWGKGRFKPERLFKRWLIIDGIEIFLISITIFLIVISFIGTANKYFNLIAYIFISFLFIIEIAIDWILMNGDFYLNYFKDGT